MKTRRLRYLSVSLLALLAAGCTYEYVMDENHEIGQAKVDTKGYEDYDGINVSNAYLPVDWTQPGTDVLAYDTLTGDCRITMASIDDAKKIGKGSIMTFDTDSFIYLRRVVSAKAETNGEITIETESVSLPELFPESCFEIRIGADSTGDMPTRSATGTPIFYPSYYREKNEDGNWVQIPCDDGMTTRGRDYIDDLNDEEEYKTEEDIKEDEKRINDIVGAKELSKKSSRYHYKCDWTTHYTAFSQGHQSNGLEGVITFEVGGKEVDQYKMLFDMHLIAPSHFEFVKVTESWDTVNVSMKLGSYEELSAEAKKRLNSEKTYIKKEECPKQRRDCLNKTLGVYVVPIGPVPVETQFVLSLGVNAACGINSGIELGFRYTNHVKNRISGISIDDGNFQRIKEDGEEKSNFSVNKLLAQGNIYAKFGIELKMEVLIFSCAGPFFGVEPYLEADLSLGMGLAEPEAVDSRGKNLKDAILAAYELGAKVGLALNAGMAVNKYLDEFLDLDKIQDDMTKSWTVYQKQIFKTPGSIRCLTGLPKIRPGKDNKVTFQIECESLLAWGLPLITPYVMHFQAGEGELKIPNDKDSEASDRQWDMVVGGKSQIIWTPKDANSTLTAYLFTYDGGMISCTISPMKSSSECNPVDMGTSCLWAPMNVGAAAENDSGDLVGWGDPTGQHLEQCYYDVGDGTAELDEDVIKEYYGGKKAQKNISGTSRDYARKKWGGSWRMPTRDEWQELIDKCDWKWSDTNHAYLVTNRSNPANYIIIPCTGYRVGSKKYLYTDYSCEYWTSTLCTHVKGLMTAYYFCGIHNRPSGRDLTADGHTPRCYGHAVRPVTDKPTGDEIESEEE